ARIDEASGQTLLLRRRLEEVRSGVERRDSCATTQLHDADSRGGAFKGDGTSCGERAQGDGGFFTARARGEKSPVPLSRGWSLQCSLRVRFDRGPFFLQLIEAFERARADLLIR